MAKRIKLHVSQLPIPPLMTPPFARIRSSRIALGLSQTKAADLIGVTQPTWAQWEAGKAFMSRAYWYAWRIRVRQLKDLLADNPDAEMPPLQAAPTAWEIRAQREAAGLSQRDAARLIGVTARTWSAWEGGAKGGTVMPAAFWFAWRIRVRQLLAALGRGQHDDIPANTDPEAYLEYCEDMALWEPDDEEPVRRPRGGHQHATTNEGDTDDE